MNSDDLGCVLEEVLNVSAEWYNLGLQLKVRTGELNSIRAEFTTPKHQLREMLNAWLTTSDNPSWEALINALRSRSVGACQLAGDLETKYCPRAGTELDRGMSTYFYSLVGSNQKCRYSKNSLPSGKIGSSLWRFLIYFTGTVICGPVVHSTASFALKLWRHSDCYHRT